MINDFEQYINCPLCEQEKNNIFYRSPYDSKEVKEFIHNYYKGRVDSEVLKETILQINWCDNCDFYWHKYVLKPENLYELYNKWIDPEESRIKQEKKSIKERMSIIQRIVRQLEAVNVTNDQPKILDFGSGWGTWALCARALGCDVYVAETSIERMKYAEKQGLKVIQDIESIPDNFFDLMILSQVLEHIPQPKQSLKQLLKFLHVGGGCR
ncbi:class I SAM-dependent methyltransferase [Coleofasciculus sp.]|uniref:class I SAM-dependent methyltransferase n=1 Tax=Coleofasciculus sp. TaxID=3100458 RepID=UPI0039F9551E